MYELDKLLIRKVTQKIFFVQINILPTFDRPNCTSAGHPSPHFTFSYQPMKNLFLAICIVAGTGAAKAAVVGPGDGGYSKVMMNRATTLTRALASRIHFNLLNGASPEERDTRLAEAQQRYETDLTNLLQPKQLVAYHALRTTFTAHRLR